MRNKKQEQYVHHSFEQKKLYFSLWHIQQVKVSHCAAMSPVKKDMSRQRNGAACVTSPLTLLPPWDWWLCEIFPQQSLTSLYSHYCLSSQLSGYQFPVTAVALWSFLVNTPKRTKILEKRGKHIFQQLLPQNNCWMYSNRNGKKLKERRKKCWVTYSLYLPLCSCIPVLQLPSNQHNSPGKQKLNKTLFISLSRSLILTCYEQSIPNRRHNGHLSHALNASDWTE